MAEPNDDLYRHIANCLIHSLKGAERIGNAILQTDGRSGGPGFAHAAHPVLVDALHSLLIVAEECRQAFKERNAEMERRRHTPEETGHDPRLTRSRPSAGGLAGTGPLGCGASVSFSAPPRGGSHRGAGAPSRPSAAGTLW